MRLEKLGVTVAWQGATIEALTAIASEADKLGFGYFWVPEAWGLEALSTISHILDRTSNMRVGVGIANVFSRSAALIGMACVTLDQIAPGRFVLGLGSSGRAVVENWHGLKFSDPLKRTEEYVQVIRKVAVGETVEFKGDILEDLSRFRLFTKPIEPRKLEIYLGAIGDANLKLAGKICDGAILAEYPTAKLEHAMGALNGGGEKRKLFTYLHACISDSEEELERASKSSAKNIAFYIASMGSYYPKNLRRLGYGDEVEKVAEAHTQGGSDASASAVSKILLGELSLIGPPRTVAERIANLPEGVIPVLGFSARSRDDVVSSIYSLKLLAKESN